MEAGARELALESPDKGENRGEGIDRVTGVLVSDRGRSGCSAVVRTLGLFMFFLSHWPLLQVGSPAPQGASVPKLLC